MCKTLGFDAGQEGEMLQREEEIEEPNPSPHSIVEEPAAKRICRYSI